MKTFTEFIAESIDGGLYSFRRLNPQSAEFLYQWSRDNRIPHPIPADELHCTVVCSEVSIPEYEPDFAPIMLTPASYKIDILNEALVLEFKCDPLEVQWQRAMNLGGKNQYHSFIPHISLAYKVPLHYDYGELKPPPTTLVLDAEQCRPMVNGWAALGNLAEYTIGDMTLGGGPGIYVPQNSLNIPREQMPQIADANKMGFVDWLENQGIDVQYVTVPVAMLRCVQNNIDLKKVENLAGAPGKTNNNPIIISKDSFLLDGHHRWLAILNRDPHFKIAAYRVNLPIQDLLQVARNYGKSFFQQDTPPQ